MSRTIVVTGAASGMGRATAERLRAQGHRVIGVDVRGAEVTADLSAPAGRQAMADTVAALAPDGIDGVVAAAGVSIGFGPAANLAVNYFGVVATFELLRPLLLRSAHACAVAIVSTAALSDYDDAVVDACLAGDEPAVLAEVEAREDGPAIAYPSSKQALARWLRRAAISPEWGGSGLLLNGVAPGAVRTPMIEPLLANEEGRAFLAKVTPIALPDKPWAEPEELAEVIAFLATLEGRYLLGQIVFVDGGTEAIGRPGVV